MRIIGQFVIFLGDDNSSVLLMFQITQNIVHLVDQSRITSQTLNFFVGNDDTTDSFCQIDQQGAIAHVVLCDLGLITAFSKVGSGTWPKNWKSHHSVTNKSCAILDQHRIENSHPEFLFDDVVNMIV